MALLQGGIASLGRSLIGRCSTLNAVTLQPCRAASLGGNRDYRKAKIDFSWQKQGRAHPHIPLILMEDDPELGPKYREVRVKRPLARRMILLQKAEYANYVTRKKYGHLAPKEATAAADWANTWFLENFRLPVLIPQSEPFGFYASDIQIAIRQLGVHLPLDNIYLPRPISSYGDHRISIMVPTASGDGFEQVTVMAHAMREEDAMAIYRQRQGVETADVAEDEEYELVGEVIDQYKTLRSSRVRVKEQMEDDRVRRINELRKKRGLPPLPLPSERKQQEQQEAKPAQQQQGETQEEGDGTAEKSLARV